MVSACDGRLLGIGHRGRPSTPPTPTAEKIALFAGNRGRPTSSWLMFRGAGVLTCRSGADRPPHLAFGARNRAATAAGASARDRTGHACLPASLSRGGPSWSRMRPCPPDSRRALDGRVRRRSPRDDHHVTTTMPYVRCIRCGVRCFSAARWSNVEQCGVCGTDLPRRPVDPRAAVPHLHPVRTPSFVLPAAVPDGREVAVIGVGPTDGSITRPLAARAARSA